MKKTILIFSMIFSLSLPIFNGCKTTNNDQSGQSGDDLSQKMDIFLRNELDKPDVISGERPLTVIIQLDRGLDEAINSELASKGLKIISAPNNILTAEGYGNVIKDVATLPYVVRIQLSRDR